MVSGRFSWPMTVLLVGLMLAIAYDGLRLAQDQRFNDALITNSETSGSDSDSAHRRFANAYLLQQRHEFKAAVQAYAEIHARPHSQLQMDVKFNLANLYFREALRLHENGDEDLAMPLLELAKENYKEILRSDETYWDAKYNLELALIVAPELDPVDTLGELNPERSPRAITKIQSRDSLP